MIEHSSWFPKCFLEVLFVDEPNSIDNDNVIRLMSIIIIIIIIIIINGKNCVMSIKENYSKVTLIRVIIVIMMIIIIIKV